MQIWINLKKRTLVKYLFLKGMPVTSICS